MLRLILAASAPSATTQRADGSIPASSRSVESFTHSPFRAADQAVKLSYTDLLWLRRIKKLTIPGALDECDTRLHRITVKRREGEDQRLTDKAMDKQLVLLRIDVRNTGVAALEVKSRWRNDAIKQVERRTRCAHPLRCGICRWRRDPDNLILETRGLAITDEARARNFHPGLDDKAISDCLVRARTDGANSERALEKNPAVQNSVARSKIP